MTDSHRADLLIELGCEELPPKSLDHLSVAFFDNVCDRLEKSAIEFDRQASMALHTPRRLAMVIAAVAARQPDRDMDRKGPAVKAAFDADGNPTPAALGFARSVGREVSELDVLRTEKGEWLHCQVTEKGRSLQELLFPLLKEALENLPVTRPMRWADNEFSFVRPVHWLVVLHGDRVLEGQLFGHDASRNSYGHRIHSSGPVPIATAGDYVDTLAGAYVLVDPQQRRERIRRGVNEAGTALDGVARMTEPLLAEVNNIVEWPVPIACSFDERFLRVPQEALIASMEDHQKVFPVLDATDGRLTPAFIAVANLETTDIAAVRSGYERVIRPRLADAQFFWDQDLKQSLETACSALDGIVFQKEIGSVGDKSRRVERISRKLADLVSLDSAPASRAAQLAKCDLVSHMVGEFPELQGVMGAYYAEASGEPPPVAQAIAEQYAPRYSGDVLPESDYGRILALADRLDTLTGIFAAGLKPSGSKDPFALRRAALGVVRLLTETGLRLDLDRLLAVSANSLADTLPVSPETLTDLRGFIIDRARQYFRDHGADARLVSAVLAAPLTTLADLRDRLDALAGFMRLPEAADLVAANKRIGNILRKADQEISDKIDEDNLVLAEEKQLFDEVLRLETELPEFFAAGDYEPALTRLARLRSAVASFFDEVMVMDENLSVRNNRLALLLRLKKLFDRVADLSLAG
jgi:glycyl-tRNA synthetase beta chain